MSRINKINKKMNKVIKMANWKKMSISMKMCSR